MIIDNLLSLVRLDLSGEYPLHRITPTDKLLAHPNDRSVTSDYAVTISWLQFIRTAAVTSLLATLYKSSNKEVLTAIHNVECLLDNPEAMYTASLPALACVDSMMTVWNYEDDCCIAGKVYPCLQSHLIIESDLIDCSAIAEPTKGSPMLRTAKPFMWEGSNTPIPAGIPVRIITKRGTRAIGFNMLLLGYPMVVFKSRATDDLIISTQRSYSSECYTIPGRIFEPEYLRRECEHVQEVNHDNR